MKPLAHLFVLLACGVACVEAAPRRLDMGKRATSFTPSPENAVSTEMRPLEHAEVLQDKRALSGELLPRQDAIIGERRSPISVSETRPKQDYVLPENPEFPRKDLVRNDWGERRARISTSDSYARSRTAERFQSKINEAAPVAREIRATIAKETTFDRINRFVFRKNASSGPTVQRAGSGQAAVEIGGSSSPGGVRADLPPAVSPPTREPLENSSEIRPLLVAPAASP